MMDIFTILIGKADKISKSIEVLSDLSAGKLPQKDVLTIKEVSIYTGLSNSTLYHESSRGLITFSKKGKKLYFPIIPFIDWYIESYFQNSVRRRIMELAFGSEKSCKSISMEDTKKNKSSDVKYSQVIKS